MRVPELRFRAEDGTEYPEWEQKRLGDIATCQKGAPLSKADISTEGNPLILYGELYTTYGEVATDIIRKTDKNVSDEYISRVGDVIIPTSGETPEEISTATCVMVPGVVLGGDLYIVRTYELDGRILSYLLNHQVNGSIARIAQGKSIVHLRWEELKKISIFCPSAVDEQHRIAAFLSALDEVIVASEKEVAALERQKKGAMQRIFSREVRFKDEDGNEYPEWKTKRLGDCTVFIKDGTHGTHENVATGFYLLSAKDIYDGSVHVSSGSRVISKTDYDLIYKQYCLQVGDVVLTIVGTLGRTAIISDACLDVAFQRSVAILRPNENMDSSYMKNVFDESHFQKELEIRKSKGAQPGVYLGVLAAIAIPVPSLPEQRKIAAFLSDFDAAISASKRELDAYKRLKRGLMQRMFI